LSFALAGSIRIPWCSAISAYARFSLGSYRSGLITPVFKLSDTSRRGTPPKNANASTWATTQASWSMRTTGRTNMCREQARTITNAQILRTRPVAGSAHDPKNP